MSKSKADKLKESGFKGVSRGTVTYVAPEDLTVIVDPKHPLYDPRVTWPLDETKIADFAARGVVQSVVVRENGRDDDGKLILQVIDGRRRVLHAREVNVRWPEKKLRVPTTFVVGDDTQMLLYSISLNAQREDETLTSSAVKVAAVLKLGATEEDVAEALGCGAGRVKKLKMFLNLHKSVQKALDEGAIPIGNIETFAAIPREEQPEMLAKVRENGATKRHEVTESVQAARNGREYKKPVAKKTWGRGDMSALRENLALSESATKEVKIAVALLDVLLGKEKTAGEFSWISGAIDLVKEEKQKNKKGAKT